MAGNDRNGKAAKHNSGARIKTLSDLNRHSHSSDSDADDSDSAQEYYAGGERSGMVVQGPPKRNNDNDAATSNDNLEPARRINITVQGTFGQIGALSSSRAFSGTGRSVSGVTAPSQPQPLAVVHNITFWRNGFTVGDGPLRTINHHENHEFLERIMQSECPKELEPADSSVPVHVNLATRDEDYPFEGVGRTLGSSSPSVPSVVEPSISQSRPSIVEPSISQSRSSSGFAVDFEKPWTSIQLRLSDGTRMVVRFNHHHTVGDIRALIDAARPVQGGASSTYQLQAMGFPPKPLNDPMQTIDEAGIINSVVLQKF